MPTADSSDSLTSLFQSYWAGSISEHQAFSHSTRQALLRRVKSVMAAMANDLAEDLAEDVLQNVCLSLTTRKTYDAERGYLGGYVHSLILTAIRQVRAENAQPGQRTRLSQAGPGKPLRPRQPLRLDDTDPATGRSIGDIVISPDNPIQSKEEEILVGQILALVEATAQPTVARALELVYLEGISLAQAADRVGVHRTTLQRKLKTWVSLNGIALAA